MAFLLERVPMAIFSLLILAMQGLGRKKGKEILGRLMFRIALSVCCRAWNTVGKQGSWEMKSLIWIEWYEDNYLALFYNGHIKSMSPRTQTQTAIPNTRSHTHTHTHTRKNIHEHTRTTKYCPNTKLYSGTNMIKFRAKSVWHRAQPFEPSAHGCKFTFCCLSVISTLVNRCFGVGENRSTSDAGPKGYFA